MLKGSGGAGNWALRAGGRGLGQEKLASLRLLASQSLGEQSEAGLVQPLSLCGTKKWGWKPAVVTRGRPPQPHSEVLPQEPEPGVHLPSRGIEPLSRDQDFQAKP